MPSSHPFHIAFYKFVRIARPRDVTDTLRGLTRELLGSILVAGDGVNGMLCGSAAALDRFQTALLGEPRLEGLFNGITFRRSACRTLPFGRIKVHERAEILPLGVAGADAVGRPGLQLDPQQWRSLLDADDIVLIDNRNSFEYRLGRFRNAVDPQVNNFRDLPAYIEANAPSWKAQGKRVAMYCTGGIRCEKTAAWMLGVGLVVHQLEGGILRYLAEMPDAELDWQGECFVFDNRIALDVRLQETAATPEDVFGSSVDEQWRLQRARRLSCASQPHP
jgi:UPF0176 protein